MCYFILKPFLRIYLPFLILPFAFTAPLFSNRREIVQWLLLFHAIVVVTAIISTATIFLTYKPFESFTGELVTTPVNHVRYSLMVSCSIFTGRYLFNNIQQHHLKIILAGSVLFLIVYLHLLSVRSGLLGFYFSAAFIGLRKIVVGNLRQLPIAGSLIAIICFCSYAFLPSFRNKVSTTQRSVQQLLQSYCIENPSDFGRVKSIEAGIQIGASNFWTSVGLGDVRNEVNRYYHHCCPDSALNDILPHNQFVFAFTATGLLGLLLFSFAVVYPIFCYRLWKDDLAIGFNIILLASFLFDHTLETQIGISFYLFFQGLLLRHRCP